MMRACDMVLLMALFAPFPIFAEQWVALGGNLRSELDTTSISKQGGVATARIRHSVQAEQGMLSIYFYVSAYCGQDFLYMVDGEMRSTWSSRIVKMPNLSDDERTVRLPVKNPAFQNLYDYICRM